MLGRRSFRTYVFESFQQNKMCLIGSGNRLPSIDRFRKKAVNYDTRPTLIRRIRDLCDQEAWGQFVDIYGPLLYRYGRQKRLQDADSVDLMQEVLGEVARSIGRFDYDPKIGRFRNWLLLIARRRLVDLYRKKSRRSSGSGDTAVLNLLRNLPAEEEANQWEMEYRQRIFVWAMQQVRHKFLDKTWQAFERTAIGGESPLKVAKSLGISIGTVYVARSRVIKKLRAKVAYIDDSFSNDWVADESNTDNATADDAHANDSAA